MFNIITPQLGDRILINCFYSVQPGFFDCSLLITRGRPAKSDGVRPNTFGRDKFNNTNCDHFNIKGTVISLEIPDTTFVDGISYMSSVSPVAYAKLPDWFRFGKFPETGAVITPGIDFDRSLPRMYYRKAWPFKGYTWGDRRMKIHWVSRTRAKVSYFIYGGEGDSVTAAYLTVCYVEFNPDYTQKRSLVHEGLDPKRSTPKWIDITSAYGEVTNVYQVLGNGTSLPYSAADIFQRFEKVRRRLASDDSSSFGFLTIDTAQSLKVWDMNLGLYLADFFRFKSTVLSFADGLKDLSRKGLTTAYLSYHYGLRLTYEDTKEILRAFRRTFEHPEEGVTLARGSLRRERTLDSAYGPLKVYSSYNMMIYCGIIPHWFTELTNYFLTIDLFPTLELVWDIIPFSFVVDWFLKVGDELEALDSRTLLSTYDIFSCVYSRRSEFVIDITKLFPDLAKRFSGELTIVDYHRTVSNTCPPYQPLSGLVPTRPFTHWVEGAALIIQRL